MILNVDDSSKGNPSASGGVIRQPYRSWLISFAGSVSVSTNLHVELCA